MMTGLIAVAITVYVFFGIGNIAWNLEHIGEISTYRKWHNNPGIYILYLTLWPFTTVWHMTFFLRDRYEERLQLKENKEKIFRLEEKKLQAEIRALEKAGELPPAKF